VDELLFHMSLRSINNDQVIKSPLASHHELIEVIKQRIMLMALALGLWNIIAR